MTTKYTFFMHLNATRHWLQLTRKQRSEYFTDTLSGILHKYEQVSVRLFDVEAFSAKCSDIVVFETANLRQYCFLIDALRDSKMYTVPYFDVVDIIPAVEDGFLLYEASLSL